MDERRTVHVGPITMPRGCETRLMKQSSFTAGTRLGLASEAVQVHVTTVRPLAGLADSL